MIDPQSDNDSTEIVTVCNEETIQINADITSILAYRLGISRYELAAAINDVDAVLLTKRDHSFLQNALGRVATSSVRSIIATVPR